MAEKEAVLESEDQDLNSIQTLLRQHEALEVGNTQQDPQGQEGLCLEGSVGNMGNYRTHDTH